MHQKSDLRCSENDSARGVPCSGGAYWEGGSGGAGSIFTLGRFPQAGLRQYSLAGSKLTYVNTFNKQGGNFTSRAGRHTSSSSGSAICWTLQCLQKAPARHGRVAYALQLPEVVWLAWVTALALSSKAGCGNALQKSPLSCICLVLISLPTKHMFAQVFP